MKLDSVQDVRWSARAIIPENVVPPVFVPRGAGLSQLRGRSGDLLVYRLPNSNRLNDEKLACLRSLNLRGIGSAALCDSRLPNTWGMIDKLYGHVAVIELDAIINIERKSEAESTDSAELQFERLKYGTNTCPGELVRHASGDYFAFESDRDGVRLMWGSSMSVEDTLQSFQEAHGYPAVRVRDDASLIVVDNGKDRSIRNESTARAVRQVLQAPREVLFARIAFKNFELTWQAPHNPFDDRDVILSEVGINAPIDLIDLASAREFARATGRREFFQQAGCQVLLRIKGNLKIYDF